MEKRNFALGRQNFIIIAISVLIVILGFILMSGGSSTEEAFNADIFSFRRIKLAPVMCFVGFLLMVYGILKRPSKGEEPKEE
ncbi:MAG: DUF3098 domain-containing protein [Bacteroidaceae bacterium]|nr:DUF3098 domain-containing protein [Bacteroidaceae bacterium]